MEEQEAVETTEEVNVIDESLPSEEEESAELEQEEESSESSEEEPSEETTEKKPKTNRVQQRISDLVQERKLAELEAAFYKQKLDESQKPAPVKEVELEKINPPGLPPDRYDFDDDAQFQAAVGKYQDNTIGYQRQLIREEMQLANQGNQEEQVRQRQHGEQQEAAKRLKNIEDTGSNQYQDFNEVAFIPQEVAGFVTQFPNAVDIAYHWGKHPEERAEITQLARTNPTLAAAKIGALDAQFAAKEKQTTKAPAPVKTVGAKGRASTQPDPSKDFAAWSKWRNEEMANKR